MLGAQQKSRPWAAFLCPGTRPGCSNYCAGLAAALAASAAASAAALAASAAPAAAASAAAPAAASTAPATVGAAAASVAAGAASAGAAAGAASTGAGAAAGAGASTGASSFLPQAVRATAASRLAIRMVFFMKISNGCVQNEAKRLNRPKKNPNVDSSWIDSAWRPFLNVCPGWIGIIRWKNQPYLPWSTFSFSHQKVLQKR